MIKYLTGDIWKNKADVIVIPVNTVGVMGAGLALEAKKRDPQAFEDYKDYCRRGHLRVGRVKFYIPSNDKGQYLLFFPTKEDWRAPSKLEYIEEGLKNLTQRTDVLEHLGLQSIAFPQLGCGCGGLDWKDVKPLMEKYLNDLDVEIKIYVKGGQE